LTKEEKLRYEKNWDRISSEKTLLTAAKDEGLEEGVAIGIEKGIEEGKKHEKFEIAKRLKELGMSAEEISNITGLNRQEVDAV